MENKNLENIATTEESLAPKKVRKKLSYASKRRFKHGGVAIAFTAIFVAVVIMLNIGATILAQNVSLTLDLTSNKDFSISEENKEYVKKIDRKVNIVVCSDKETYQNDLYQYAYSAGYMDSTQTGYSDLQQYFNQNVYLIEEYEKLNKNISVEFIDPSTPDFTKYTSSYPDANLGMGNILVESTFTLDGKEVTRHRVMTVKDLFRIDTQTSQEYSSMAGQTVFVVTGNDVETALTSAIYTVTADRSYKVALITANGGTQIAPLQSYMEMNNYEFTEIKSLVTDKIPENADVVILSQPTHDYSEDELNMLDKYLEFSAEQKKTLMYIGSSSQATLPNLNELLSEWGFSVVPEHTVFETEASNYSYMPTNVMMTVKSENGFSDNISRKDYLYIANKVVPVVAKQPNDRTMKTVLEISSSAVAVPNDAGEDYKIEDAKVKGAFVGLGVSEAKKYDSDNNLMTSSVIMLSATDFITSSYNNFAEVGNIEMLGVVIDKVIDKTSVGISFDTRTFEKDSFIAPETATADLMNIIVVWVPVVAVVAAGVIVFIRRRRS
ncbi:MAG: GldG family protein [Clostridia bacterium]|nr:GldG family protein [Clostridia bacterium]